MEKDIDSEEFELFSIFDKNFIFKLDRYYLGSKDPRILWGDKYGANFLFDQVSYGLYGRDTEGGNASTSNLTDLGENITEIGLKWFLDDNKYKVKRDYDGIIRVEEKQQEPPDENINIINTNNSLSLEEKKISNQTVFNQISKFEKDIDREIETYAGKFITDVKSLFQIYFEQNQITSNTEIKTGNNDYGNRGNIDKKIADEVNNFIDSFCSVYDQGMLECLDCAVNMSDKCNFKYLVKKVIAPLIINYFQSLDDNQKQNLINGNQSIVAAINNTFQNRYGLFNRNKVINKLVKEIYYNENNWSDPKKYDKYKKKFVQDDFKFNFDEAKLEAKKKAMSLNESFGEFKKNMARVYNGALPDIKDDFEKNLDKVDCSEFINFLKDQMKINVDQKFLKKAIIAMFYTWAESVHGNEDNGNSKKVAERLADMRRTFFDGYSGTRFIHEVKLYASSMIDKGENPLPDAFYWYNSDVMLIGQEYSQAYRFTVVNYFQAFFNAILALKRKKFENLYWWSRWWSHRKFNKNIEKARRILQTGTEAERKQIFNRIRRIRNQKYKNNIWGLPLAFIDILFDGVSIDLSLKEKIEICTLARNYVDHELDNPTKKHVTKSNFMEIDKKNNRYLKSGGQVILPIANLFAPGAIDELVSKITNEDEVNEVWAESFCRTCCDILSDAWHCKGQSNIFIKLLAKALFVLLFTCFSHIIGIVLLIAYIVYVKDLKNKLNKLANEPTFNKLRQAEINGREEYNELQNFRQDAKKEKPPTIIEIGKQKINLNIDMNRKFNIINDLKINNGNNVNNSINNNIINTSSKQIDDLFN